jgi:hypothetical protein
MGILRIAAAIGLGVVGGTLIKHGRTTGEGLTGLLLAGVAGKLAVDEVVSAAEKVEAATNPQLKRLDHRR